MEEERTKNLTLAEAHASGKNYRRAKYPNNEFRRYIPENLLTAENAYADDYELETEARMLTRAQVLNAIPPVIRRTRTADKILNALFGEES